MKCATTFATFCFASTLTFLPQACFADIFTIDNQNGDLFKIDTAGNVTPFGTVPSDLYANLPRLYNRNPEIDLTYLDGYIYGLVLGTQGVDAQVFRFTSSGSFDSAFGLRSFYTDPSGPGEDVVPYQGVAEGIATNGTHLIIGHGANDGTVISDHLSIVDPNLPLGASLTTALINPSSSLTIDSANLANAPASRTLRDIDGLGSCRGETYTLDIAWSGSSFAVVKRLGYLPWGSYSDVTTFPVNTASFGDIAFTDSETAVLAGLYQTGGEQVEGLHYFDISNANVPPVYISSIQIPLSASTVIDNTGLADRINSVASSTAVDCPAPVPIPEPCPVCVLPQNYLCYDLLEHEQIELREKFDTALADQFGEWSTRIGHAVSICNPVGINGRPEPKIEEHYVCYSTVEKGGASPEAVEISNIHEQANLIVGSMDRLCVVSSKKHLETIDFK